MAGSPNAFLLLLWFVLALGCTKEPDHCHRAAFSELHNLDLSSCPPLGRELLRTDRFDDSTVFHPDDAAVAAELLADGKNPGLGVRALHAQGLTGAGVIVAIIDLHLALDSEGAPDHPEYVGKILEYRDFGTEQPSDSGSMHGPSVTSLLLGSTLGVAPDARAYYAAYPSGKRDSAFPATALDWIVERNAVRVSAGDAPIRAVTVSAGLSGRSIYPDRTAVFANQDRWRAAVNRAEKKGILVVELAEGFTWVYPGTYDETQPDDFVQFTAGYPNGYPIASWPLRSAFVIVPASRRTSAIEYKRGSYGYHYTGKGGASWGAPWATGLLALGWQQRPDLDGVTMKRLFIESARKTATVEGVVDPAAFIKQVQAYPH